jgi:hypothetical protein
MALKPVRLLGRLGEEVTAAEREFRSKVQYRATVVPAFLR